ncbi:MAG: protein kinase domain-containing protein [Planctomycetota bacterium]
MSEAKEQNDKRSDGKGTRPTRSLDGSLLEPGGQIGPFHIEQELGRGAMGVVYLAHDSKLDRPVAIKSLPAELMEHPTIRTRFEREARFLASLNHPNVATIYDELQEAEGVGYLVLEYVPGQTLADRIAFGRLKPQEALTFAQQIAEAVAAAHEHGIIHRDLKPDNIKITPEGRIKVLDFGLAKALDCEEVDQDSTVTKPGRIMGTPQVRGLETDERCDIWSFGCVLYEMLTGKVPFEGKTVSDTLASVLDREPDFSALPEATPANIRVLLRRCLEKDPYRRLHDIADAKIEISETLSGSLEMFALPGKVAPVSRLFRRDVILAALVCSIAGALIVGVILVSLLWPIPPEREAVLRTQIRVPPDKPLYTGIAPNQFLAISPDGTHLVYVGRLGGGETELYMRPLDSLQITPIPGTRNAHNPFFSSDGQWVGFFTERQLKKVSLVGGKTLELHGDIALGKVAFGSWGGDRTIVFSDPNGDRGLQRIPHDGGQAETLIPPAPEEDKIRYCYPQTLPGGNAILYSHVCLQGSRPSCIKAFLPKTDKSKVVLDNASYAAYVNSGHLIFMRGNVLMAISFDVEQLKPTGLPIPLGNDNVGLDWTDQTPQIAISSNGTVIYMPASELRKEELVWLDPNGIPESLGTDADAYEGPRVSPDGEQIAVGIRSQKDRNIRVHICNVQGGPCTPLTTEGESCYPQWSPDGKRIAFWGWESGPGEKGLFCKVVGATALAAPLASTPPTGFFLHPHSWSQDLLACTAYDGDTLEDIWIVDLGRGQEPKLFLGTEHREYNPALSPDRSRLAFVSEKSGQPEIYVREYPDGGQQWIVPTRGATNPVWSRDGPELYYICDNKMMAVTVPSEPNSPLGKPRPLFQLPDTIVPGSSLGRNYDVSDAGRFLMVKTSDYTGDKLIVVTNWFEELKRLAPPGRK